MQFSTIRKGTRLHRLLYGDDEGIVRIKGKGSVSYYFERDRFAVVDLDGEKLYGTDLGIDVERWLIERGWIGPQSSG